MSLLSPSRTTFQRRAAMGSVARGCPPAGPRFHCLATIGSRGEARTRNGQDGSSLARWTEQGIARSQRRAADEAFSESRNVAWAAKSWLPPPATRRRASGQAGRCPRGRRDSEAIRGRRAAARPAPGRPSSAAVAWDGRPRASQRPSPGSPYSRCGRIRRLARWTFPAAGFGVVEPGSAAVGMYASPGPRGPGLSFFRFEYWWERAGGRRVR